MGRRNVLSLGGASSEIKERLIFLRRG